MRSRAAFTLAVLALISALAMLLAAPAAEATVMGAAPNGWTTHGGPGYELYISPQQQVGASELSLIVNYGDSNMTLRVSKVNQTISSAVIAPHSSRFVQLDFASNGTYRIVLANETQELLALSKTRIIPVTPDPTPPWNDDDWHIIPPGPSPWQPGPDPSQDPLAYTQAAVDELIASVTLESLLTTASLMAIAMFLGAAVQRAVRFIWPTAFITVSRC